MFFESLSFRFEQWVPEDETIPFCVCGDQIPRIAQESQPQQRQRNASSLAFYLLDLSKLCKPSKERPHSSLPTLQALRKDASVQRTHSLLSSLFRRNGRLVTLRCSSVQPVSTDPPLISGQLAQAFLDVSCNLGTFQILPEFFCCSKCIRLCILCTSSPLFLVRITHESVQQVDVSRN